MEELECVECFTPNSRKIGMTIPYRYNDAPLRYEPDFVVRLRGAKMLVLEINGVGGLIHDPNQVAAKNAAAGKWVEAVNNTNRFGQWVVCLLRRGESPAPHDLGARRRRLHYGASVPTRLAEGERALPDVRPSHEPARCSRPR